MRGQLLAIVLLVAAGSATFIMMRSMHASLVQSLNDYYQRNRYPDVFIDVKQAPDEVLARLKDVHGVEEVQSRIRQRVSIDLPGLNEVASAEILSIPSDVNGLCRLHVVTGKLPSHESREHIVLYAPFAEANGLLVGDSITVLMNGMRRRLRIAATAISPEFLIIMSPGTLMLDNRRNAVVWMDHEVLAARFNMTAGWNSALVKIGKDCNHNSIQRFLDSHIETEGAYGVSARSEQLSHRFITDEIKQNEISALIIPAIIFGVAVFLLNVSINRLVTTQRSIIAIMRAFGYTRIAIALHYVVTAFVIVIIGTALGITTGYLGGVRLASWYMEFYRFPRLLFAIPADVTAVTFAVSLAAANAGALGAVRSVIRLQPADAMRPPAPKRFTPGLLSRCTRTLRISSTSRLVLRNMDRRLAQSSLVMLMIALAASIIMLARYMNDAMDHMMFVEYERSKLADATVSFARAVPVSAAHDLESIEGVAHAEPFRMYGVDIIGRTETYRTTIASRAVDAKLARITDQYGSIQNVPAAGVMMSAYLAKRLALSVGDSLTFVSLEGARDTIRSIISSLTREALGAQCYATPEVLSQLRSEEPLANGAFLKANNGMIPSVQMSLKERPAIIGLLLRTVAIRSFRDVYGANVLVVAGYLFVLACLVAVGVLYNNARIVIAERTTELATLRIQGFTINEITRLMLGEQSIDTAFGIPLGLILGAYMCYMIAGSVEADFLRLPFVISRMTLLASSVVVSVVSIAVALRMYFMLRALDLVAVLKERV